RALDDDRRVRELEAPDADEGDAVEPVELDRRVDYPEDVRQHADLEPVVADAANRVEKLLRSAQARAENDSLHGPLADNGADALRQRHADQAAALLAVVIE